MWQKLWEWALPIVLAGYVVALGCLAVSQWRERAVERPAVAQAQSRRAMDYTNGDIVVLNGDIFLMKSNGELVKWEWHETGTPRRR